MKAARFAYAAAVLAVLATAAPAGATLPGPNGRIAFHSDRAGTFDLWTMNADGGAQTAITDDAGREMHPAWSPDARDIAFVDAQQSGSAFPEYLVVVDANGTNPFLVTPTAADRSGPTWSPDGSMLAYGYGGTRIAVIGTEGGGSDEPITQPSEFANDSAPDWSPVGDTIVFQRNWPLNDSSNLVVVNPDGTGEHDLTTVSSRRDQKPSVSPDGETVVFARQVGGTSFDLYTVPIDGGTEVQITDTPGFSEWDPVWSPDGTKIAFSAQNASLNWDIYVVNADGTGQQRLTTHASRDDEPNWARAGVASEGFPRPKGATPVHVPLVPAYQECAAPNRTHGPPLAFGSCAPPAQASQFATVGTPDANGHPAASSGHLRADVLVGNPATPADEADVRLRLELTDVRHRANPSNPYALAVFAPVPVRLTDKNLGCCGLPGTISGTFGLFLEAPCVSGGPGSGATCSLTTTADSLIPGAVPEGKRSLWEIAGPIRVYDAGEDGHASSTDDNTLLATGGIFIP